MLRYCCFTCKYYCHLDPDTDFCNLHNFEVYFDYGPCINFELFKVKDKADK